MKASDGSHVTGAFLDAPHDAQQMLLRLNGHMPLLENYIWSVRS